MYWAGAVDQLDFDWCSTYRLRHFGLGPRVRILDFAYATNLIEGQGPVGSDVGDAGAVDSFLRLAAAPMHVVDGVADAGEQVLACHGFADYDVS